MINKPHHIALVGNPNVGKTSLFNQLTGLKQKTGNFAGVTVEKKQGSFSLGKVKANLVDLPGTYSLNASSEDEQVVNDYFNGKDTEKPDLIVFIADSNNLRRNLYLFNQVREFGYPSILVLNFHEEATNNGLRILDEKLSKAIESPVIRVNAKNGKGISTLKAAIAAALEEGIPKAAIVPHNIFFSDHPETLSNKFDVIDTIIKQVTIESETERKPSLGEYLDKWLTHPFWGYAIFIFILAFIFQVIFNISSYPMDLIDESVSELAAYLHTLLPQGPLNDMITEGVIPGIGGVVIFIPQIASLFLLLSILEESGYMARVVFLMDPLFKKLGLNGKSIIPYVSAAACAIPAVMSARGINNYKERLITILTAPFISCSARLPVYAILIALLVPETTVVGFLNLQGVILLGLYALGAFAALASAYILKKFVKASHTGFFMLELPPYRLPSLKNMLITMYDKSKTFVFEAGKIILAISVILWALASYGPSSEMDNIEQEVALMDIPEGEKENKIHALQLEASYAGIIGKFIEPAIRPLGYDWKLGIALITSFAAREVFVGTISTIYSIDDGEETKTIKQKLRDVKDPVTGGPFFNRARSISLLLFYVFAMQCMSTLAIVYKETKSIKWPLLQLFMMTGVAYLSSLIAYQLLK